MPELKGKTAIVTGATSGIGRAIAEQLAAAGVKVLLAGRNVAKLQELAAATSAEVWTGDLNDPKRCDDLFQSAVDRYGTVDIVINNAGLIETGPVESIDLDRVCEMVRVNVESAFRMAYLAVRHFKANGQGHLINTSSVLGTKVRPTAGAYAGTKYAIEALSEALRMELGRTDVQVTCIEPGLVLTQLHNHMEVHPTKFMEIDTPLMPEDIAETVMFALQRPGHVRIPKLMVLPKGQEL
ncbi:MAG: SDR family oxidoreductase [SAR324 cluster bacterium]|nr:SDR family oxidoreductase [SAR324 cluster bacterium]